MRSFIAAARKPYAAVVTALALGLVPPGAHAQTGGIVGQVTEASTGQPLSGARVAVEGTGHLTLTNDAGRYMLEGVPPASAP